MSLQQPHILVTGAAGQLGSCFRDIANEYPGCRFLFADRQQLDIADAQKVDLFFEINSFTYCINCAAYTAVDKAETEREPAEKINATAVGNLAKACKQSRVKLIQISTDYVFNGLAHTPYTPADATDPVNFYGLTKLHGEQLALEQNDDTLILRTAWVYSMHGNNFVKTMLRLMKEKEKIGVVSDQRGTPTYAADLARAIMQIIVTETFRPGIFHYTNAGETTWFDFAREIAAITGSSCIINRLSTAQFPTPAARPMYSVLDMQQTIDTFRVAVPAWQSSLRACLASMA